MSLKRNNKKWNVRRAISYFPVILLLFPNYGYSYKFPDSIPYTPYSSKSTYFHKSYPEQECTPKGMDTQTLRLEFSQRTKIINEFRVGWNYYSSSEIPNYLKPTIGGEIQVARCLPPGKWAFLGKGNVIGINGNIVEALIKGYEYKASSAGKIPIDFVDTGNMYWRPMAGDVIFPVEKIINKKLTVSPKIELSFQDLFISVDLNQYSYELSKQGEEILKDKFEKFKNLNGKMLIEGFILTSGNREELRIESLMRAQSVSKYLANTFNINENQIISIGYVNDWIQSGMQPVKSWPNKEMTHGIVLRMIPESN
ncbi:OmpA family protein [Silvanigrella sp.]|jgi:hypothetical protein|uniref:OmpA family protein n=1 Tax=Silvanigrella sp. TaxID=2024976 RepID=UPI0037C71C57